MARRNHTALLLESGNGRPVLLDAGEPVSRTLLERGVDVAKLDGVCISHGHSDHTGGLPMLIQGMWLAKRTRPLDIWLPGELILPLRAWLEAVYLGPAIVPFALVFHAWEAGKKTQVGDFALTPFDSTHLDSLHEISGISDPDRFRAYGFVIEAEDSRLIWSADIGAPEDLAPALQGGASLVVAEVAHFPSADLFSILAPFPIGQVAVTHFPLDTPEFMQKLKREAAEILPVGMRFVAAHDGLTLTW